LAIQHADFFVSRTGKDKEYAIWIAWHLEQAGYPVLIQDWDFRTGSDFLERMQEALQMAERILAVVSKAYFESHWSTVEWRDALFPDNQGRERLVLVRIDKVEMPPLLRSRIYIDLTGLNEKDALKALLEGVKRGRIKPSEKPKFPKTSVSEEPLFSTDPSERSMALLAVQKKMQEENESYKTIERVLAIRHQTIKDTIADIE
jgi:TIR domain-containing protein